MGLEITYFNDIVINGTQGSGQKALVASSGENAHCRGLISVLQELQRLLGEQNMFLYFCNLKYCLAKFLYLIVAIGYVTSALLECLRLLASGTDHRCSGADKCAEENVLENQSANS